jgi:hypothetical protein
LDAAALEDLLLVVSEIVTNAVLRGRGDVGLHAAWDGAFITATVGGFGFAQGVRDRDPSRDGDRRVNNFQPTDHPLGRAASDQPRLV